MHRLKAHTPADRPSIPASGSRRRRSRTGSEISHSKPQISEAYNQNSLFVSKNPPGVGLFLPSTGKLRILIAPPVAFKRKIRHETHFFAFRRFGPRAGYA